MDIYKVLQQIMLDRKLSVAEVARICNLSDSTVRGIITRQQKSVALEVAFKLSRGLNVSLEYLNGESDNKLPNVFLDPSEIHHIKKYRLLTPKGKETVDELVDNLYKMQQNTVEVPVAAQGGGVFKVRMTREQLLEEAEQMKKAKEEGDSAHDPDLL